MGRPTWTCIFGNTPSAIFFYGECIHSPLHTEPTILTPICPPRIANDPILEPIFFTPTSYAYKMVMYWRIRVVEDKDAPGVEMKQPGIDSTCHRTSLINFCHHVELPMDLSVLSNHVTRIVCDRTTMSFVDRWFTGATNVDGCAFIVTGLVQLASLFRKALLIHVLVHSQRITPMASACFRSTVQYYLYRVMYIRPLSFAENFMTICQ